MLRGTHWSATAGVFIIPGLVLMLASTQAISGDWRGDLGLEYRWFYEEPTFPEQHDGYASAAFEPEWYHENDDGSFAFTFVPFARVDQYDEERTHYDLRELNFLWVRDSWELRAGLGKVFWGVTEARHLVDIINQTDLVEQTDGEAKLGQPMIDLTIIGNWGTLDLFVLPGFRERTFPGIEGRLRSDLVVDTDNPIYESDKEEEHIDFAIRWAHYFGAWDIGLSHFHGTSRDPILLPEVVSGEPPVLRPLYPLIDQTGVDIQATINSWLLKLEVIRRSGFGETYVAAVGGFEYTFYGVFEGVADIGMLAEYNYDDRRQNIGVPFDNDIFSGLRLTLNDAQSTTLLAGCFFDLDAPGRVCQVEGSRRLSDNWFLELEVRLFSEMGERHSLYALRNDDFLGLTLEYNF
jgi:hypothetical protein